MDRAAILSQLRLDSEKPKKVSRPPMRRKWLAISAIGFGLMITIAGLWAAPQLLPVPVRTATAALSTTSATQAKALLEASGYVVASRKATVASKVTGKLSAVFIDEGQPVKAGQIMARLDDASAIAALRQADAAVKTSRAKLAQAEAALRTEHERFARSQRLHETGYLSNQSFETADEARSTAQYARDAASADLQQAQANFALYNSALGDTVIRAPFDGIVIAKAAQPGEIVSPITAGGGFTRTGIGTVVDMDSLEVSVDVAENFISRVHPGMPASVTLNAYPDRVIPAHVVVIIPSANRAKATVEVKIGLDQKVTQVLPDMGVKVAFLAAKAEPGVRSHVIVIPHNAVKSPGDMRPSVFVISKQNIAEKRYVTLGGQGRGEYVVTRGLEAGEVVAISHVDRLRNGRRVSRKDSD